jgi:nucleoside-diphosphate-sugar epimerase
MRKKIVVTGATMDNSQYLVPELSKVKEYDIFATYTAKKKPPLPDFANVTYVKVDWLDAQGIERLLNNASVCFHLETLYRYQRQPFRDNIFTQNTTMHKNIFEAAVKNRIDRIIYWGSPLHFVKDSYFDNYIPKGSFWKTGNFPRDAYRASKLFAEYCCYFYAKEKNLAFTILNVHAYAYGFFKEVEEENIYLPIASEIVKNIVLEKFPLELPVLGKKKRPYIHLADYADALIKCMDHKAANQELHIGSLDYTNLPEIIRIAKRIAKPKKKLTIKWSADLKMIDQDIRWDYSKAEKLLGWKQKIRIHDGIAQTVRDFQSRRGLQASNRLSK